MFKPNTLEDVIRFDIICSSGLCVFHSNVVEIIAQFAQVAKIPRCSSVPVTVGNDA